jgi:glutaredoxin
MEAVIYSNGSQECERIKSLLESLTPIVHVYVLGKQFTEDQFRKEFGEEATYPQIAIGHQHVGSMKEALQYMSQRGLFT